jgi:hypothetical protein
MRKFFLTLGAIVPLVVAAATMSAPSANASGYGCGGGSGPFGSNPLVLYWMDPCDQQYP